MLKSKTKKLASSCCAAALMVTCSISAFAVESPDLASQSQPVGLTVNQPSAIEDKGVEYHPKSINPNDILSSSRVIPYSTSIPAKFYDLANDSYYADLELVGPNWLYTNYYFSPNSSGVINVGYLFDSVTGRDVRLVIGLYNITTKKMETTFSSGYGSHVSSSMHFYNLNKSSKYAIAFSCQDTSSTTTDQLTGNATIFH